MLLEECLFITWENFARTLAKVLRMFPFLVIILDFHRFAASVDTVDFGMGHNRYAAQQNYDLL